jgi:hypothetical protein
MKAGMALFFAFLEAKKAEQYKYGSWGNSHTAKGKQLNYPIYTGKWDNIFRLVQPSRK